ncbi:MAG: tripartite tricarboxylate transporter substrate binding protein [Bacillota bacterium]
MKKLMAVVMSAVLCMGLAGCGGSTSSSSDSSSSETATGAYPSGAVKLIVPFSAGGGTDLVARAAVDAAKDNFPKGISVENKTGGSGAVGMIEGANAAKDGSVITMICVELVTVPHTTAGIDMSPDQFEPVLTLNSAYSAITVKADSPYETLDDLLAAAGSGIIQVGNSGVGAIWHLAAATLGQEAGVEFTHIPFEGAAPALTSLLGGHIDAVSVSYPEVSAQAEAGEVKILAILSPERNAAIPDVPTAIEEGYDVSVGTWRGLAVPAGTDQAIVDSVYDIFSEAAEADSFVEFMNNNNLDIDVKGPAEFAQQLTNEWDSYGELVATLGLGQ